MRCSNLSPIARSRSWTRQSARHCASVRTSSRTACPRTRRYGRRSRARRVGPAASSTRCSVPSQPRVRRGPSRRTSRHALLVTPTGSSTNCAVSRPTNPTSRCCSRPATGRPRSRCGRTRSSRPATRSNGSSGRRGPTSRGATSSPMRCSCAAPVTRRRCPRSPRAGPRPRTRRARPWSGTWRRERGTVSSTSPPRPAGSPPRSAERVGASGRVVAADVDAGRLRLVVDAARRLHLTAEIDAVVADGRRLPFPPFSRSAGSGASGFDRGPGGRAVQRPRGPAPAGRVEVADPARVGRRARRAPARPAPRRGHGRAPRRAPRVRGVHVDACRDGRGRGVGDQRTCRLRGASRRPAHRGAPTAPARSSCPTRRAPTACSSSACGAACSVTAP